MRRVGVIKQVPTGFELYLELRNCQRPRSQGMRQPPFEIEESQQPLGIFGDGKLPSQLPRVARKSIGKRCRRSRDACRSAGRLTAAISAVSTDLPL